MRSRRFRLLSMLRQWRNFGACYVTDLSSLALLLFLYPSSCSWARRSVRYLLVLLVDSARQLRSVVSERRKLACLGVLYRRCIIRKLLFASGAPSFRHEKMVGAYGIDSSQEYSPFESRNCLSHLVLLLWSKRGLTVPLNMKVWSPSLLLGHVTPLTPPPPQNINEITRLGLIGFLPNALDSVPAVHHNLV